MRLAIILIRQPGGVLRKSFFIAISASLLFIFIYSLPQLCFGSLIAPHLQNITPTTEGEVWLEDFKVTLSLKPESHDSFTVSFPNRFYSSDGYWLIVFKQGYVPKTQRDFRHVIWKQMGDTKDIDIEEIRTLNVNNDGQIEIELSKNLLKRSFIVIDNPTPVRSGGPHYTIDLPEYLKLSDKSSYAESILEDIEPLIAVRLGKSWGYVNKMGKYVINPQFEECSSFVKDWGYAAAKKGGKWGLIDKTGHFIVMPLFDSLGNIDSLLNLIPAKVNDKWGYINRGGKLVIRHVFDRANAFDISSGLAVVAIANKWGFIDMSGKIVIEPQFDKTWGFNESSGLTTVEIGGKWGFINRTGRYVINPQFDR